MVKEELEDILTFWRGRQQADSGKDTFRFKRYFADRANKDLQPATYGAAAKAKSKAPARKRAPKKQMQPSQPEPLEAELPEAPETPADVAAAGAEQDNAQGPAQEIGVQGPAQGSSRGIAAPYSLGFPTEGNCNMNEHGIGPLGAAAGDYTFSFAESGDPEPGGLEFDLNSFNLDPDLARIAMQYTQPAGNGFLEGEPGFLDTFLDQLNNDDGYGLPVGPVMPFALHDRPMPFALHDRPMPMGPISLPAGPMLHLPPGDNSNDVGSAEADWGNSLRGPEQRLPVPAAAADPTLRTINQNEMQKQVPPTAVGPNVTTRASSRNAQQEVIPKRPRGRPKKIVANAPPDEGQIRGVKRVLDDPEAPAGGANKKAKTTKTAAGRKPTKGKAK